jgi:predicted dehydrogenase
MRVPRSPTLSIIQVGVGGWGRSWAEVAHGASQVRLAAVVDASPDARAWAAGQLGVQTFASLAQASAAVEAEAALVVTPPVSHRAVAEEALGLGLHVVCEKPLAPDLADARALAAASHAAGLHVMAAQNYRFQPQARALQALVRSGELGSLLGIRIVCRRDLRNSFVVRGDWRATMPHPYVLDMAIHHVDLLRMISGQDVRDVDARTWRVPDSPFTHEPSMEALMTLADGTPVAYEGSWAAATGPETSWNGHWELVGEQARVTWSGGALDTRARGQLLLERYGKPVERLALPRVRARERLGVLDELRRALNEGRAPECEADDNVRTLQAVFAIAAAAEQGRAVTL